MINQSFEYGPKTDLSFNTNEVLRNPTTTKSAYEKVYNPNKDYEEYLKKANYKTKSDCLSVEKSGNNTVKSYHEKLLKSIERKALKDQYGTRIPVRAVDIDAYSTRKS
jgi:hypothetical protein